VYVRFGYCCQLISLSLKHWISFQWSKKCYCSTNGSPSIVVAILFHVLGQKLVILTGFVWFSSVSPACATIVPQERSWPFTSTSIPSHYSLIMSFDTVQGKQFGRHHYSN
jgi:hypothetical protein